MKKAIAVICALVMTLGVLSACKNSDTTNTTNNSSAPTSESASSKDEKTSGEASSQSTTEKQGEKTSSEPESTSSENTSEKRVIKDFPSFDTEDIFGAKISGKVFSESSLTMVYIFSSQSDSCKSALTELAKLDKELENIGFLAIVLDINEGDGIDEKALRTAKEIYTDVGADYPYLITNDSLTEFCREIYTVPTTYFVDKDGNIVGDPIVGDNDANTWKDIVEQKLSIAK